MSDETQSLDRRIERTRLALRNALILMLAEHSWDDINIRDLCAQANVGRSTFYLHFQGKEELLVSAFDDLRGWLASHRSDEQPSNALPFVRGLIEHADEQRQLFRIIIGRRSGHIVHKRFREMVIGLVRDELTIPSSGWQREAAANYVGGALVELLAWWIDSGKGVSADDVEQFFYRLVLPTLEQL